MDATTPQPDPSVTTARQHTSSAGLLRWFAFDHLPPHLQAVSSPFATLAQYLADALPADPEATVALRKLLEAKDAAVRAAIAGEGR